MLELGVCYYPEQWDRNLWQDDARRMVELGLDWVRLAEFSWAKVEPEPGRFDWQWLDDVIAILGDAGLKIMMSTPTAAPPKWLVELHPEILPVGKDGVTRKFGARRHYCFSSDVYKEQAARITEEFARRYGNNPCVKAWQIDNEYGDHDTVRSYSDAACRAFRVWLAETYGTIDALNQAWGTAFWAMTYNSFDAIDLPNNLVDEPNPGHAMDFARFSSDQVRQFNKLQADILHAHAPDRPVTHNFMANSFDFDHFDVARDLDFAAWDSYPLGALMEGPQSDQEKRDHLRTGSPDYQSFYCDLYRHVGKGKVWITEQQPGPVNWASFNQAPADGMVRLWTWMAYAHGAEAVFYFRWRQPQYGQEQYHTALLHTDGTPDQAYHEIAQVAQERALLSTQQHRKPASVAMIVDYPSRWAAEILSQGQTMFAPKIAYDWYKAMSEFGVDVDIVGPKTDFADYKLILIPDMILGCEKFVERLASIPAKVVLGPRVGSKITPLNSPQNLAPGAFARLIDMTVARVESLPPIHSETVVFANEKFETRGWRESVKTTEKVVARFLGDYRDGGPAIIENDKCCYIGCIPERAFLVKFAAHCLKWAGIKIGERHQYQRQTTRGDMEFIFNFNAAEILAPLAKDQTALIGNKQIEPFGVGVRVSSD